MRVTSRRPGLVAVAVLMTLMTLMTSCGGDDGDADNTSSPPERVAEAVTRLAEANTGHVASETGGLGGVHSRIEGDYQLSPPAAALTVTRFDAEGEARDTEVLAIGVNAWSRNGGGCWIHYSVVELFDNGLLVRNGDTFAPAAIAVVGNGGGVYATNADQVAGTSELTTVLSVADQGLATSLGLDRADDHQVRTTFLLDDGTLSGWRVFVRDAVTEVRALAPTDPVGVSRVNALSALGGAITTQLTDLGDAVDIVPPPVDAVVEFMPDGVALDAALRSCTADQGGN